MFCDTGATDSLYTFCITITELHILKITELGVLRIVTEALVQVAMKRSLVWENSYLPPVLGKCFIYTNVVSDYLSTQIYQQISTVHLPPYNRSSSPEICNERHSTAASTGSFKVEELLEPFQRQRICSRGSMSRPFANRSANPASTQTH